MTNLGALTAICSACNAWNLVVHRECRRHHSVFLYPPSEHNETGRYTVFTYVCLSVCTQSINRLCTGRWSPWCHRCTACCGKSILRDIIVTFLYISPKTHFDLEPAYIIRKPIKWRFQQYFVSTEILSTFHTQVEYISWRTTRHSALSNEWGCTQSSQSSTVCPSHNAWATWRMHSLSAF